MVACVCGFVLVSSLTSSKVHPAGKPHHLVQLHACTNIHTSLGKLFAHFINIYAYIYISFVSECVCCGGFKCPSSCPDTSMRWFPHKWNTAVD